MPLQRQTADSGQTARTTAAERPTKMTPRGRLDYDRLDAIGFDVVEEQLSKRCSSIAAIAREHGVAEINLRLWRRMRRTRLYCDELAPDQLLDLIAAGATIAEIARDNDLSTRILEKWVKENCVPQDLDESRELAAESQFARAKDELGAAIDDVTIRKAVERHKVDRFHAERTTKRFSDEKTVRVTGLEGVIFNFNTNRLMSSIEAEQAADAAAIPGEARRLPETVR